MDDLYFPKKILRWLLVGAMLIAIAWGVLTGDSQKAFDLWKKEVGIITKPLMDRMFNRMERATERAHGVTETASTTEVSD